MDLCRWTLVFLLLIQLTLCFKNEKVFLEKRFSSGADMTSVCGNDTGNVITKVQCSIQKGNNGSVLCSLQYVPGRRNDGECGSRITLQVQNQTVFLNLMDLTPEDSGLFYCECFREEDIFRLHLNVTVEDSNKDNLNKSRSSKVVLIALFGATVLLISTTILGFIIKRKLHRKLSQSAMAEGEEMDTYAALQQPSDDVYQTIAKRNSVGVSVSRHDSDTKGEYENIENTN